MADRSQNSPRAALSSVPDLPGYWDSPPLANEVVPVARPQLPPLSAIAPYIRRVDENRWYSNIGPLVREFESRLAACSGVRDARAITVANATLGLMLALRAHDVPRGSLCMMPSWTFAATGHAALGAGLTPWIVDVEPATWALEADAARHLLRHAPGTVSSIICVSPFGQPIDPEPWEALQHETGLAIVIDAAAAFDRVRASRIPSVISLHATKALGIGEGGFVLSTNPVLADRVLQLSQFGFWQTREAQMPALNAKISEYAAAVGLAALDAWPATRAEYARIAATYRRELSRSGDDVVLQDGYGIQWVTSTTIVTARRRGAAAVAQALAEHGIGSRRWWGGGLHRHRAFQDCPRDVTTYTDALAETSIGLPCWPGLVDEEIARICRIAVTG